VKLFGKGRLGMGGNPASKEGGTIEFKRFIISGSGFQQRFSPLKLGLTSVVDWLNPPPLHIREEVIESVLPTEVPLGPRFDTASHLRGIRLRLLLLISQLLKHLHLAQLIRGELLMLLSMQGGKRRWGGRTGLVVSNRWSQVIER